MERDFNREFIKVNRILGKQASIGPIPADQLGPWVAIIVLCYVITNGFLVWVLVGFLEPRFG
jgi:hypothetical protein